MRLPKSLIIAGLIAAAVVIGWKIAFPTNSFRYKVTVNVETPEGLKSGSAVREARIYQQPEVGESGPWVNVWGEAVVVDLGARGVLFAVMGNDDYRLVFRTFPTELGGLTRQGARHYERLEAKAVVDPLYFPLLVAFKDIEDPKTVTVAYKPILERDTDKPGMQFKVVSAEDNMEKLFGKGVRLKDITLEMTTEPVTWGIENYLPSYGPKSRFSDWYNNLVFTDPRRITLDNFKGRNKNEY